MSSASPPKEPEVERGTQSGDDAEQMERENPETQAQGQGEFEVKEQDRWLPIANGIYIFPFIFVARGRILAASLCLSLLICAYLTFWLRAGSRLLASATIVSPPLCLSFLLENVSFQA